jgi:hypothetical protein
MCLHGKKYFKNLLLKNHLAKNAEIFMKAMEHNTKVVLLPPPPAGLQ